MWLLFDSPEIAIITTITIDLIGALPTVKHTWQKPYEETWLTFFLAAVGAICTLLATTSWQVTAIGYPLYIVAINGLLTGIILARYKRILPEGEPAELRKL